MSQRESSEQRQWIGSSPRFTTKLHLQSRREQTVGRPRLVGRLKAGLEITLTVVAAPQAPASRQRGSTTQQPLIDAPTAVLACAKGSWGPKKAGELLAGDGRWHEPWIA
jgi:hypothetical protein